RPVLAFRRYCLGVSVPSALPRRGLNMSQPTSRMTYSAVYILLMVLLAATVGVAKAGLGSWSLPAALAVSAAKTMLIVLFFMHLRATSTIARVTAFVAVMGFLLLLGMTIEDAAHRDEQARLADRTPRQAAQR